MLSRSERIDTQKNVGRILSATISVLNSDTPTSIDVIARSANIAPSTVNRHFATRKDIHQSALAYLLHQFRAQLTEHLFEAPLQPNEAGELATEILRLLTSAQPGIHRLVCLLTETQMELVLRRFQAHVIDDLRMNGHRSLPIDFSLAERERLDVIYRSIEGLLVDFIRRDPSPHQRDAYHSILTSNLRLLLSSANVFSDRAIVNLKPL